MVDGCADAIGAVPAQRWVLEQLVDMSVLSETQRACVVHGGFVARAERFDSRLFGVSRAEASKVAQYRPLYSPHSAASFSQRGSARITPSASR